MQAAVDQLEGLVQKTEADLNNIVARLELDAIRAERVETAATASAQSDSEVAAKGISPLKVVQAVHEIRAEHAALVKEIAAIRNEQKESSVILITELKNLSEKLELLEKTVGIKHVESACDTLD